MDRNIRYQLYIALLSLLVLNPFISSLQWTQGFSSGITSSPSDIIVKKSSIWEFHGVESFAESNPAIKIEITGPERANVGDEITYIITVTNDSNKGDGSIISDVALTDDVGRAFVFIGGDVNNNNLLELNEQWQYERPLKVNPEDPDLIEFTVYATGEDLDGDFIVEHASIQLIVGYNPKIILDVSDRTIATIGETITFQITVTNQILTVEVQPYDISGIGKHLTKTPGNKSRIIKGDTFIKNVEPLHIQLEDLVQASPLIITAVIIGLLIGLVRNALRHQYNAKFLVFCILVGLVTGIGYSGFKQLGWGEYLSGKSQILIKTPIPADSLSEEDDRRKVINIGDGSPVTDIKVSSTEEITINYIQGDSNQDRALNLGESWLYEFSHTVEQTDPDLMIYPVIITGLEGDSDLITLETNLTLEVEYKPVIDIQKTGPESARLGESVTYGYMISNNSTIGDGSPVSKVSVLDGIAGPAKYISGDQDEDDLLEVGESWTYTVTHVFLISDLSPVERIVTVTGQGPDGKPLSYTQSYNLDFGLNPSLQVIATGPITASLGQPVNFSIEVINDLDTGDGSPVGDLKAREASGEIATYQSGDQNTDNFLSTGESWIFELSTTISEVDSDPILMTFIVSGQDQDGDLIERESTLQLEVEYYPFPAIQVTGPDSASVGDQVNYQIIVTNDMNQGDGSSINNLSMTGLEGVPIPYTKGDSNQNQQLELNEDWVYEIKYTILPTFPSELTLPFAITGTDQDGDQINSIADYMLDIVHNPAMRILATSPETAQVGERVTQVITITHDFDNSDGSPLKDIKVTHNLIGSTTYMDGDNDQDGQLDLGENWIFTSTFIIQDTYLDPIETILDAVGNDLDGEVVRVSNTFFLRKFLPFANGDFENTDTDWIFQNRGLETSMVRTTPTGETDIPIGSFAALLGRTDYACSPDGVPMGYAEIRRKFTVPQTPTGKHVRLSFNYVIYSQDASTKPEYDRFEVIINDSATPVFSDGNQVNEGLGCNVWWRIPGPRNIRDGQTSGWATGLIDLDRFQGQIIEVSFQNHNRFDGWYNTYTYLDNIEILITD